MVDKKRNDAYELVKKNNWSQIPNPKHKGANFKGKKIVRHIHKKVSMASTVQKLFRTCQDVFAVCGAGIIPSPDNIEKLRAVLDDMQPSDFGLEPEMPCFHNRTTGNERPPAIRYLHLFDCDNFSIGIFCLPPSGVIPLHNHPGMTVFSKLLFGRMHIKAFDWVADNVSFVTSSSSAAASPGEEGKREVRLAKVKIDSEFVAPCKATILYPADGGNMHRFTAITACAVLDVLGPPYSDLDGRHCQYFLDLSLTNFSLRCCSSLPDKERRSYAWLQQIDKPEDLSVVAEMYSDVKFQFKCPSSTFSSTSIHGSQLES